VHEFLRIRARHFGDHGPAVGFVPPSRCSLTSVYMQITAIIADTHVKMGIVAGDGRAALACAHRAEPAKSS